MAKESNNSKRMQTTTAADETLHITDLPVGILVDVASYLSKPSRALFATAMSAPSTSWQNDKLVHLPSATSKAIISAPLLKCEKHHFTLLAAIRGLSVIESTSRWEELDFEEIETSLSAKLSDDDIGAVLKCINAKQTVKRFKLAGCINITGRGLDLLRGSTQLELMDISLEGRNVEKRDIIEEPIILSQEVVIPILESIVATNGCSLIYVNFPTKWCQTGTTNHNDRVTHMVRQFRVRYQQHLSNRELSCASCDGGMENIRWLSTNMCQNNICYDCLKPFCGCGEGDGCGFSSFCHYCRKCYCHDCNRLNDCACCAGDICWECGNMTECDNCGETCCEMCINTCDGCGRTQCHACNPFRKCCGEGCDKANCDECFDGEQYTVNFCEECEEEFCFDCQLTYTKKEGENSCEWCAGMVAPVIVKENTNLCKKVEELTKENKELVKQHQQMTKENEELRKKLKYIMI